MSVEENKEAVYRMVDIVNSKQLSRLKEVYDENVVYRTNTGVEVKGLEAYRGVMSGLVAGLPDTEYVLEEIAGEGDKVHFIFRHRATHTGELLGIPASNRKVDYLLNSVCTFQNGKVIEQSDFYDLLTFLRQIGVVPQAVRLGGDKWPVGGAKLVPTGSAT